MVAYNWTGVYVGGHAGVGLNRSAWGDPAPIDSFTVGPVGAVARPSGDLGSHTGLGFVGGGQAGFNIQSGPLVIGVEASYSYSDVAGDHTDSFTGAGAYADTGGFGGTGTLTVNEKLSSKVRGIITVAGRLGIASLPSDRALFYVTGGGAYMRQDVTSSINGSSFGSGGDGLGGFASSAGAFSSQTSGSINRWGWMAGAGLEFGLFDNWSAKVEYNYLDFGTADVTLDGTFTQSANTGCPVGCSGTTSNVRSVETQIHMIKFGLNYRFMGGWY